MNKPCSLQKGDKIAIVSLSRGLLGEKYAKHELDLALKRLEEYGLIPVIMDNALKGVEYLGKHPEARAADLKQAFMEPSIKAIITAIGGNDTYKLIPYLMEDEEFKQAVKENPKIFTGYSDTTNNHLMLNKLGLSTFYGPCLLVDIAELDNDMLPYTKEHFEKYFMNENGFQIKSSPIWYSDREDYSASQIGKPRIAHKEVYGYEILNGSGVVSGKLYGGCIESIYDALTGASFEDEPMVYEKYDIFPSEEEWTEKVLFLETSELSVSPYELEKMLMELKSRKILSLVKGVIVGKPIDEKFYQEYKQVYKKVFSDLETPVLYNLNFGHSFPRCIIPYDAEAIIDYDNKTVHITSQILEYPIEKTKTK